MRQSSWGRLQIRELGKFHHDRTLFSLYPGNPWVFIGKSSPFIALPFRLVKYYNLPRWMMDVHFTESDVFFSLGMAVATERCCHMSKIFQSKYMMGFCLTGNPGNLYFLVFWLWFPVQIFPTNKKSIEFVRRWEKVSWVTRPSIAWGYESWGKKMPHQKMGIPEEFTKKTG